ncbi:MAG: exodeoxyribonuclease VII small subunit [Spirochaetales bacterium]|nr:exodeoxyribonuclease VII small subunit [Spirochaetales bacterium]
MSFEDKLTRLEEINDNMKDGGIPIEKAMKLFEEGIKLASSLEKEIGKMERKVEILINKPDTPEEEPKLELFTDVDGEEKD